jgi:hypothetical protein
VRFAASVASASGPTLTVQGGSCDAEVTARLADVSEGTPIILWLAGKFGPDLIDEIDRGVADGGGNLTVPFTIEGDWAPGRQYVLSAFALDRGAPGELFVAPGFTIVADGTVLLPASTGSGIEVLDRDGRAALIFVVAVLLAMPLARVSIRGAS